MPSAEEIQFRYNVSGHELFCPEKTALICWHFFANTSTTMHFIDLIVFIYNNKLKLFKILLLQFLSDALQPILYVNISEDRRGKSSLVSYNDLNLELRNSDPYLWK